MTRTTSRYRPAAQLPLRLGVSTLALLALAAPALAQTPAADAKTETQAQVDEDGYEVEELIVTAAAAQRGAVIGDIPPEIQLSARDIRAYGVSNVADLIAALAPQTSSGRGDGGRPVILVNGQRISSFVEVRDLPSEAIARIDILPEEVSLKYGYRADQRVVNLVLRRRFRAVTAEAGFKTPTQGDGESYDGKLTSFRIQSADRALLDAKVSKSQPILESDRAIGNTKGDAGFRSLSPETESVTLTATLNRPIREGVAGGLNASFDASRNQNLLGLSLGSNLAPASIFALSEPTALRRTSEVVAAHVGGTANGALKGWSWSLTANADRSDSQTTTDRRVAGVAFTDKSRSIAQSGDVELVANGVLTKLPAGSVSSSFKAGLSTSDFDTRSLRAGVTREGDLARDMASFQANLDVPLTSRSRGVGAGFGDVSGNLNVAVDQLSDFGTLTTFGGGLNWSPIKPLRIIASFTEEDNAPTVQQLGAPEQATPGVRVFDFRRGETVEITRIDGGAAGLRADNRSVMKLGLTLKPFGKTDVTFSADYVRTRINDVIATFPTATNEIEAAFPERFVRDADGQLLQIDSRPVNFDRRDTAQLRWGFTFRKPLGPVRPPGGWPQQQRQGATSSGAPSSEASRPAAGGERAPEARLPEGGPPPGEGGRGRFGGRGFGGGGFGGSRGGNLQIGLYHTLRLQDEVLIRPGVARLDLLDGAALGNSGGQSRHQVDLQANASKNGYGLSMNARWQSSSRVDGGATGALRFADLTTVNARLFIDLGVQPWGGRKNPWLQGARVSLAVDNLFDSRQQVRTAAGDTPVNFQPDYLDPLGRQVRISFRKLFF